MTLQMLKELWSRWLNLNLSFCAVEGFEEESLDKHWVNAWIWTVYIQHMLWPRRSVEELWGSTWYLLGSVPTNKRQDIIQGIYTKLKTSLLGSILTEVSQWKYTWSWVETYSGSSYIQSLLMVVAHPNAGQGCHNSFLVLTVSSWKPAIVRSHAESAYGPHDLS